VPVGRGPKAARERFARPRAGTALAPPSGSHPECACDERADAPCISGATIVKYCLSIGDLCWIYRDFPLRSRAEACTAPCDFRAKIRKSRIQSDCGHPRKHGHRKTSSTAHVFIPDPCAKFGYPPGVYFFAARASALAAFDGTFGSITMLTWR
jgi:hypothetical protein